MPELASETILITLSQQIAAVKREIAFRESLYPRWIDNKKLKPEKAAHEIAAMKAVLATLEAQQLRETPAGLF